MQRESTQENYSLWVVKRVKKSEKKWKKKGMCYNPSIHYFEKWLINDSIMTDDPSGKPV